MSIPTSLYARNVLRGVGNYLHHVKRHPGIVRLGSARGLANPLGRWSAGCRHHAFRLQHRELVRRSTHHLRPWLGHVYRPVCVPSQSGVHVSREIIVFLAQTLPMYFQYVFSRSTGLVSQTCGLVSHPT